LVAAVSNAGALGFLGTGNAPPDWVREQVYLTRALTDSPFGINIMVGSTFADELVEVAIEEKVPVVATGGGDPSGYVSRLKSAGLKVMPVVSDAGASKRLEGLGADAVVAEGMESGGHVGDISTMALVPQVVDSVSIPVVAAGGIADGRGLAAALALGAQAVQMGTRFICAEECTAHRKFKERILAANGRASIVIGASTGHPLRCLENRLTGRIAAGERSGASVDEYFRSGRLYAGVIEGDLDEGFLMAGQSTGLVAEIRPAKQIVDQVMAEAQAVIDMLSHYRN
jgi:enoyl-[acyl-carrier protein] reductase II